MTSRKANYAKNSDIKSLLLTFLFKKPGCLTLIHLRLGWATTCLNSTFVPNIESLPHQQFC